MFLSASKHYRFHLLRNLRRTYMVSFPLLCPLFKLTE
nr:MAG TPA: hypothetical protein [Bacteriophage sp.]